MSALHRLVDRLATDRTALDAVDPSDIDALLRGPELTEALRRLDDDVWRPSESGAFWDGAKSVGVLRRGAWSVTLLRRDEPQTFVRTVARRGLTYVVRAPGTMELRRFRVAGDLASPTYAAAWRLHAVAPEPLMAGSSYRLHAPEQAVGFAGEQRGAVFLAVEGERLAPQVHHFDAATGAYAFTTFADHETTSRHLFAELFKQLTADPAFTGALTAEERAGACALFRAGALDEGGAAASRWLMLQAAAKLEPGSAASMLQALAGGANGYLAGQAARLLPSRPAS